MYIINHIFFFNTSGNILYTHMYVYIYVHVYEILPGIFLKKSYDLLLRDCIFWQFIGQLARNSI